MTDKKEKEIVVKLLTRSASPKGNFPPGTVLTVPESEAEMMFNADPPAAEPFKGKAPRAREVRSEDQDPGIEPPKVNILITAGAANLAKANEFDYSGVVGTGENGQITKRDMEKAIRAAAKG